MFKWSISESLKIIYQFSVEGLRYDKDDIWAVGV